MPSHLQKFARCLAVLYITNYYYPCCQAKLLHFLHNVPFQRAKRKPPFRPRTDVSLISRYICVMGDGFPHSGSWFLSGFFLFASLSIFDYESLDFPYILMGTPLSSLYLSMKTSIFSAFCYENLCAF